MLQEELLTAAIAMNQPVHNQPTGKIITRFSFIQLFYKTNDKRQEMHSD